MCLHACTRSRCCVVVAALQDHWGRHRAFVCVHMPFTPSACVGACICVHTSIVTQASFPDLHNMPSPGACCEGLAFLYAQHASIMHSSPSSNSNLLQLLTCLFQLASMLLGLHVS